MKEEVHAFGFRTDADRVAGHAAGERERSERFGGPVVESPIAYQLHVGATGIAIGKVTYNQFPAWCDSAKEAGE